MPIGTIIAGVIGQLVKFWDKSLILFAALAICLFLLSGASLFFLAVGFKDVGAGWVVWFFFGGILASGFAFARFLQDRKNPPFVLIADEQNSFFHLAPRADGNPGKHTQLNLHFRATNNLRGPLLLSKAKLKRPRPRWAKVEMHLATFSVFHHNYDSGYFIQARSTAKAMAQVILHRDVGNKNELTVVLEISDQRGSKQRVKFRGIEQR